MKKMRKGKWKRKFNYWFEVLVILSLIVLTGALYVCLFSAARSLLEERMSTENTISTQSLENSELKAENARLGEQVKSLHDELEFYKTELEKTHSRIAPVQSMAMISRSSEPRNMDGFEQGLIAAGLKPKTFITYGYSNDDCKKKPSHPQYGITHSGKPTKAFHTVAMGKKYPHGTVIFIPAYKDWPNHGIFVCEDRGSGIGNNEIDIYHVRKEDADAYGRKDLEVYILKEGVPDELRELQK